jgi:1-deoxyxylulose-5-phosphate synthase
MPSLRDRQTPALSKHLRDSVSTSLRMLQTDHIDLLMLHSAPVGVIEQAEEILETLRAFQQEGSVRYLGASLYETAGSAALQRDGFDCLQIAYSALDRTPEEIILPKAAERGVGIIARSVLLQGVLTSRYPNLPNNLTQLKDAALTLDKIAQAADMSLPEMAFRYVLTSGIIVLCGTARKPELQAAVGYSNRGRLNPELIARIRAVNIRDLRLLNPSNWSIA